MKHGIWTKALAVILAVALLIPGGTLLASAACEHANWSWVLTQPANCQTQTDGISQKICDDCGETLETTNYPLWQDVHDFSVQEIIADATCTTDRVSHYRCSKCDAVEKGDDGNPIDYHGGKTVHEMIADGVADSSKYYTSTTNPTCEDWGVIDYYCEICDTWICDEDIEPLGHNKVWEIKQDASEDHPGIKTEVCTRCGKEFDTETFELHEHCYDADFGVGYQRILTPATCTKDGELGTFCGVCGALFAVEPIEATGHHNREWSYYLEHDYPLEEYIGYTNVLTTKPTCTEDGVITFLCDDCGEVFRSYPLEATGHYNYYLKDYLTDADAELEDYIGCMNVETTMPTCTEDGSISFLCQDCGAVMKTYTLDATGHHNAQLTEYLETEYELEDYIGYTNVETVMPTCTKSGTIKFLCDECGAVVRSYPLDALGHDEGTWTIDIEATPDHTGWKSLHCNRCGELIEKEEFELHQHSFGEWAKNNDGTHSHICSLCGFKDTANCKYNATVTDPTCLEGGYTTYVCADCGYTYVDDYTDALGHDWGAWTDDGDETHTRTCSRCGETETEAHCFGEWVYNKDAKFFKNGTKSMTCEVCGKVVTEKAKFTAWIWHLFYPILLFVGSVTHKAVYLGSLAWFLPWLNIRPKM